VCDDDGTAPRNPKKIRFIVKSDYVSYMLGGFLIAPFAVGLHGNLVKRSWGKWMF
jgi:hypothetical protein